MGRIYIGLSGYSYKAWQGPDRFYPADIKPAGFLRYYASRYSTVELDGIWYRLPTDQAVRAWVEQAPSDFVYAPKAHRQITHVRRLKLEGLSTLQAMLERLAPLHEAGRLGPILLQLPPNFKRDDARLAAFLEALPTSHRWTFEFRHDSWHAEPVEQLLRHHGVAWAEVDTDEHEAELRNTAGFRYARLRKSAYETTDLARWAERFKEASGRGQDYYVYCKHEDEGSPWLWADSLLDQLGLRREPE